VSPDKEDDLERLARLRPALQVRARVLRALDRFLRQAGSLPVETPSRVGAPGTDVHLEPEPTGESFLITSPEFHMKRLLGAGYERIHQVCHCFRKGERGPLHNPEFTMLEWYWAGASYGDLADELEEMIRSTAEEAVGSTTLPGNDVDLGLPWDRQTVSEAFRRCAGWDPVAEPDEERFFIDLVERVEPTLGKERPTLLLDYPSSLAALSRLKPGDPTVAERFELYINGIELLNAFGELVDPGEQVTRFEADNRRRALEGKPLLPIDERFVQALSSVPASAGAALGVDRLVMLLLGAETIDEVVAFPEPWV
jgi:lysyl-tRNA synthetase class 2